ncbi:hypothetical protein IAU59_007339 [Kwoniella sp. CBS 9459]
MVSASTSAVAGPGPSTSAATATTTTTTATQSISNSSSPLTVQEKLLLSQAVYKLGAISWPQVSALLVSHPCIVNPPPDVTTTTTTTAESKLNSKASSKGITRGRESLFGPQDCEKHYVELMREIGVNVPAEGAMKPQAKIHLRLAQTFYLARMTQLQTSIATYEKRFQQLMAEVASLRNGEMDEVIRSELRGVLARKYGKRLLDTWVPEPQVVQDALKDGPIAPQEEGEVNGDQKVQSNEDGSKARNAPTDAPGSEKPAQPEGEQEVEAGAGVIAGAEAEATAADTAAKEVEKVLDTAVAGNDHGDVEMTDGDKNAAAPHPRKNEEENEAGAKDVEKEENALVEGLPPSTQDVAEKTQEEKNEEAGPEPGPSGEEPEKAKEEEKKKGEEAETPTTLKPTSRGKPASKGKPASTKDKPVSKREEVKEEESPRRTHSPTAAKKISRSGKEAKTVATPKKAPKTPRRSSPAASARSPGSDLSPAPSDQEQEQEQEQNEEQERDQNQTNEAVTPGPGYQDESEPIAIDDAEPDAEVEDKAKGNTEAEAEEAEPEAEGEGEAEDVDEVEDAAPPSTRSNKRKAIAQPRGAPASKRTGRRSTANPAAATSAAAAASSPAPTHESEAASEVEEEEVQHATRGRRASKRHEVSRSSNAKRTIESPAASTRTKDSSPTVSRRAPSVSSNTSAQAVNEERERRSSRRSTKGRGMRDDVVSKSVREQSVAESVKDEPEHEEEDNANEDGKGCQDEEGQDDEQEEEEKKPVRTSTRRRTLNVEKEKGREKEKEKEKEKEVISTPAEKRGTRSSARTARDSVENESATPLSTRARSRRASSHNTAANASMTLSAADVSAETIDIGTPASSATPAPGGGGRSRTSYAARASQKLLYSLLDTIASHRNGNVFQNPVKKTDAPDYLEVIKRPMDLKTMRSRIKDGQISTIDEFERDALLIFANAMMYNGPDSQVYEMAQEMLKDTENHIAHFKNVQHHVNG